MVLFTDRDLMRKIEDIKSQGTKEYIMKRKEASPSYTGDHFSLTGKGDVFYMDDYCFGVGFGMNDEVLPGQIELVEHFIHRKENCGHVHFELPPLCDSSLLKNLQKRGYTLDHFLAVWVLDINSWKPMDIQQKDNVSISTVTYEESEEWARTVVLGFSEDNKATEEAVESALHFLDLSNTIAFLLKEDGKSVAGANLAITDELAEMFLTSTLPPYRGKGYQSLLIQERIRYAKSRGCTHLTVTTKPDSGSARNMEKNGFQLMYNKAVVKSQYLK